MMNDPSPAFASRIASTYFLDSNLPKAHMGLCSLQAEKWYALLWWMARCCPEKLNIFLTILLLNASLFLLSRAIELLEVPTEPALGSLLRFHIKSRLSVLIVRRK